MSRILVVDSSSSVRAVAFATLERGGYEPLLAGNQKDAWELLTVARAEVDLILVDASISQVFCKSLRGHSDLMMTPVILMSEKTERIRDDFLSATGALDVITKPFDSTALLIVLENVLQKIKAGASSSRMPVDGTEIEPPVPSAMPELPVLSGELGAIPIGAILQLLQSESQTGVLVCTHREAEVRASFRDGMIDLVEASGAGDEFRLGRFFIEAGIATPPEIDNLVRIVSGRPLGMAMLATGKIVESQLRSALTKQSSELLYEVFRWPTGRFELRREFASELAQSAKLGLPVASVVLEGFRRVDEWRGLERALQSFDAVLVRDDMAFGQLDVESLPQRERALLDAVDGKRAVRAIIAACHLSSFDACRMLAQFLEARVLRRRPSAA